MTEEIDYPHEYDNSGRVANSSALIDAYLTNATLFREREDIDASLGISYGPLERNKIDIFWPETEAGKERTAQIVVFIHGGYWHRLDRSAFSHLAIGLNARGLAVAMPSYTLCPDIEISGIITEMRRACLVLYQTYNNRLTVIGHSAGGHLAACMVATDWQDIHPTLPEDLVGSGLGISGLYDLLPILKTPVNDAVRMDEEQAIEASPIRWMPDALKRFDAWVGGDESNEYHRQSRELAQRWSMLGTPTTYVSDPGTNHFTIVDALIDPDSPMVERIVELVQNPEIKPDLPEPDEAALDAVLNQTSNSKSSNETQNAKPNQKIGKASKNKRVIVRKDGSKPTKSDKPVPPTEKAKPKPKPKPKAEAKPAAVSKPKPKESGKPDKAKTTPKQET